MAYGNLLELTVMGRLGGDAEMRYLQDGTPVVHFSVAVNRARKVGDKWDNETTWLRVSAFGNFYEKKVQSLTKGSLVFLKGRLAPDKNTGGPKIWEGKAAYDVIAEKLIVVDSTGEEQPSSNEEDEIPF